MRYMGACPRHYGTSIIIIWGTRGWQLPRYFALVTCKIHISSVGHNNHYDCHISCVAILGIIVQTMPHDHVKLLRI